MPHSFTADFGKRDFNAALFADDAAVFHAFVLTAQTFIVFNRAENTGAEQAVSFRFESTIVDGFGFFNLTIRPGTNLFRRSNGNSDFIKRISGNLLAKKFHYFIHIFITPYLKQLRLTFQRSGTEI